MKIIKKIFYFLFDLTPFGPTLDFTTKIILGVMWISIIVMILILLRQIIYKWIRLSDSALPNSFTTEFVKSNKIGENLLSKDPIKELENFAQLNYSTMATIATMMGILGTFFGISKGVSEISLEGSNIKQLTETIQPVLSGLKTAFYSSMLGIGFSIIFRGAGRLCEELLLKIGKENCEKELAEYEVESSQYYLRILGQAFKEQKQTAENMKDAASTMLAASKGLKDLPEIVEKFKANVDPEKLAEMISTGINDTIKNTISPIFKDINESLIVIPDLKTIMSRMEDSVHLFTKFTTEELNTILDRIAETQDKSNGLIQDLATNITDLEKSVNNINDTLPEFIESIMRGLDVELTQLFKKLFSKLQNNLNKEISSVFSGLKSDGEKFRTEYKKTMNDVLENQKTAFEDTLKPLNEELAKSVKGIVKSFEDQKNIISDVTDVVGKLKTVNANSTSIWEAQKTEIAEVTNQILNTHNTLKTSQKIFKDELDGMLKKISGQLGSVTTQLEAIPESLNTLAEQIKGNMERSSEYFSKFDTYMASALGGLEVQISRIANKN
ncbi:MAG: MotA/TolQ/ExbB proton channel family protein [SAR202 cluster bacterium]|jgi:hypothetical protein|nr:MotA/TolQ/ExbB proton channel family protein [SAR202 cluster bacterium]|tara:strand:+ start:8129 stop:9793 length:1665 start_codon:yes stop_codon:yes gene_type:complete